MAKLSFSLNGVPLGSAELKSGRNLVGRSPETDIRVAHASVSSNHCEIWWTDGNILLRDLGSTNGTFVDGQQITEGQWFEGQSLRLGQVDLSVTDLAPVATEAAAATVPAEPAPARAGLRVAKMEHAPSTMPPAGGLEPHVAQAIRHIPAVAATAHIREQGFFKMILPSFGYPFKRDGLIALICGTLVFCLLDFMGGYSIWVAVIGFGYLAAFMQKMIVSSAHGEEEMPGWPEFGEWWGDILHPALLLVGSFAAGFGPALAFWIFADVDPQLKIIVGIALLLYGVVSLPMALLATAMYESLFALNPMLIVPSMIRIIKEYVVVCLILAVLFGLSFGIEVGLELLTPVPVVPTLISGFFSLYILIVEMRILGLMFFFKEDDLAWSF